MRAAWRTGVVLEFAVAGLLVACSSAASPSVLPNAMPSPTVAPTSITSETPNATTSPTVAPTPTADPTPTPKPTRPPTPEPTRPPTPAPTAKPAVSLKVDGNPALASVQIVGGDTVEVNLRLATVGVNIGKCSLVHSVSPEAPNAEPTTEPLRPLPVQTVALIDGVHRFTATCPSAAGNLKAQVTVRAADGKPEQCAGFDFPELDVTVATLAELQAGMIGPWEGCVATPWVATYHVIVTFRSDGTYSGKKTEYPDGNTDPAFYYGSDKDSPEKRYWVNDLEDDLEGTGEIDTYFWPGNVVRGELRNIRLMGDHLRFEFFHLGYGPLTFELNRTTH